MALRSLAAKIRVPASAAARLTSAPRVSPMFGSRPLTSSSSTIESARDWYLLQRARYHDVTRELADYRRELVWTERLAKLLDVTYILGISLCSLPSVIKGIIVWKMWKGNDRPQVIRGYVIRKI